MGCREPRRRRQGQRHSFFPQPSSSGFRAMFSRKRSETEDRKMAESIDDLGIPMKPARPAVAPPTVPVRPPAMPPRAPELARPAEALRPADSLLRRPAEASEQPRPNGEMRRLSVGREITLSGEINSCDKLFIEG